MSGLANQQTEKDYTLLTALEINHLVRWRHFYFYLIHQGANLRSFTWQGIRTVGKQNKDTLRIDQTSMNMFPPSYNLPPAALIALRLNLVVCGSS